MSALHVAKPLFLTIICVSFSIALHAQTITSPDHRVNFVELYTSQGCSSCPPAERWLNQFEHNPKLWTEIIPLNFHVDYWDYLGWKDPFSSQSFSLRQRWYRHLNHTNNVATPGFVVNGKGWNGWFFRNALPLQAQPATINISTMIKNKVATINVETLGTVQEPLLLHAAQLGFDLTSEISSGENKGKTLVHDFVVLSHDFRQVKTHNNRASASIVMADISTFKPARTAYVIWVSTLTDPSPIQAAAAWQQFN